MKKLIFLSAIILINLQGFSQVVPKNIAGQIVTNDTINVGIYQIISDADSMWVEKPVGSWYCSIKQVDGEASNPNFTEDYLYLPGDELGNNYLEINLDRSPGMGGYLYLHWIEENSTNDFGFSIDEDQITWYTSDDGSNFGVDQSTGVFDVTVNTETYIQSTANGMTINKGLTLGSSEATTEGTIQYNGTRGKLQLYKNGDWDDVNFTLYSGNLTDDAPTATEISAITGLTISTSGDSTPIMIRDTNGSGKYYWIKSDGTNWIYFPGIIGTIAD